MQSAATVTRISPTNRSRVSNGKSAFIADVDGRSKEARRFRDLVAMIVSDLGGNDHLSEGQRQLARRAALMSVECERLEGEVVQGKAIDLEAFGKLSDRIGRAFHRLGLKRVPRDVGPQSIAEYAAQKRAREVAGT